MTWCRFLPRVLYFVQNWWPATVEPTLTPYASGEYKLSLFDGCVLRDIGVVVPIARHKRILDDLHETHQGTSRIKARARMVVWQPGLNKSVEEMVSNCLPCWLSRPLHHCHQFTSSVVNSTDAIVQTSCKLCRATTQLHVDNHCGCFLKITRDYSSKECHFRC